MSTGTQGQGNMGGQRSGQGEAENVYGQASEAISNVADQASEMWDEAYDQGTRYYRDGSRALSNIDGGTWAAMFIAGAIGYGLSLLIHGQQSVWGSDRSDRQPRRSHGSRHRNR